MRRIVNSTHISPDGVVEQPHLWPNIERPADERGGQIQTDLLMACDAVLANTAVISRDVVARVAELKAQPGQAIVQYGFGAVSTLRVDSTILASSMVILTYRPTS